MVRLRTPALVLLLAAGTAAPAGAQLVAGPPGSIGGLFGGHRPPGEGPTNRLDFTFDVGSGYDDNVFAEGVSLSPDTFGPNASQYTTTLSGTLRYQRSRLERTFQASGRGYANYHTPGPQRFVGGDAGLGMATPLGRRNGLTAAVGVAYEPTFLFGATELGGEVEPATPGSGPPQGVTDQRWFTAHASAGVYRAWTPRQRTSVSYGRSFREPTSGPGYNSRSQAVGVRHAWNPWQAAGFDFTYAFNENRQREGDGIVRPLRTQDAGAGMHFQRRLSPVRAVSGVATGGVTYSVISAIDGGDLRSFYTPSASGSIRVDLTRAWALSADVSRSVTALEGLTPEPFVTNAVATTLTGEVGRRFRVSVSGAYSRGSALVSDAGSYDSTDGVVHLQYAPGRRWALFTSYGYYTYEMRDVEALAAGFPTRYDRRAVRAGMTIWLPLYGTF
jgi:hypothetical protein